MFTYVTALRRPSLFPYRWAGTGWMRGPRPATATYVRASLAEVAAALAALTGEPYPLATTEGW